MGRPCQRPAPDQKQRDRIVRELDTTMLVEAAAGTGKTTIMIDRMVALLAKGRCRASTLAAVTFTRKAAAELRSRFQLELERAARESDAREGERLAEALAEVERCFIGTIHSFCGRLLRERPVEAEVDVAFEEIDEEADSRLRVQAWDEYVAGLYADADPLLQELDGLGLDIGQLGGAFGKFAEYPDVEEWPAPKVALPDLHPVTDELRAYVRHMKELRPSLPKDPGRDKLMPKYDRISRMAAQVRLERPAELMQVLEEFKLMTKRSIVQKNWPGGGKQAKKELARWNEFSQEVAGPLLNTWRGHRYEAVLRAIGSARSRYDGLRRASGVLSYQDLLMRAARLLRENVHVCRYFRGRFTHLLVDEFQDTDPIQAEVMLLLTARDPGERDWRRCRPVKGSLFVVGDPKQSIYRFRRADIVTYKEVKNIVRDAGGAVIPLSANFRTIEPLVDWINGAFSKEFPEEATEHSPAYVALEAARTDGGRADLTGVRVLDVPGDYTNQDAIAEYEAGLIARTIRNALDEGSTVCASGGAERPVNPGDFLIITHRKARLGTYARKLQEMGIPHQVTGGSALNQVRELDLLYACLRAVTEPDNPLALVAALRGELFGVSDAALYDFKRLGGPFSFRSPVPGGMDEADAGALADAFARLEEYSLWLAKMPPVVAIERIAADLGLFVSASSAPGGEFQAGSLGKAIELLRAAQANAWTAADLVEHLGKLVRREEPYDGVPARSHEEPVVRVMNLHKVKGLEAPVVFLADPSGASAHPVELHVDRSGSKVLGYLIVSEKEGRRRPEVLAQPPGWGSLAEEEGRFQEAEGLRLLYVAATRAGAQLIIARRRKNRGKNPWQFFEGHLDGRPELADPGGQRALAAEKVCIRDEDVTKARRSIGDRWLAARAPGYAVAAAKEISVTSPGLARASGEHGTEWGTVVHVLLETAAKNAGADIRALAASALADQGLEAALADAAVETVRAVMRSDVWARAAASERRLAEVPFQTLVEPAEGPPTVLRGVIDLVFRERDGWVIVDYKTDDPRGRAVEELVEQYRPQVLTYADAWEGAAGEPVREAGLYFTRPGRYVVCPRG